MIACSARPLVAKERAAGAKACILTGTSTPPSPTLLTYTNACHSLQTYRGVFAPLVSRCPAQHGHT